jgi:beta-glucosidase
MEGGDALARILFGDVNPSGKLPFTTPKSENDLPFFDSYPANVDYGYYHGYTLFDKEKKEPRYPFGFGLSYTNFLLSDLRVLVTDSVRVSVKIKNTGTLAGAEVVQLYIGLEDTTKVRPEKLLRAFQKVNLQVGEERVVDFKLFYSDFTNFNPDTQKWEVKHGKYNVLVGNCSRDERMLKSEFEVNF